MALPGDPSNGTLSNGALPAEDAAGEVVAAIAQAQTISAGEHPDRSCDYRYLTKS